MHLIKTSKGVVTCLLWYITILSGFFVLYCPIIPVLLVSNKLFRILTDKIFALWELYVVALCQLLNGTRVLVSGSYIDPEERAVVIMNHRTRVDWNYVWLCFYHATRPQQTLAADRTIGGLINGNGDKSSDSSEIKSFKRFYSEKSFIKTILDTFNQKTHLKIILKDEIKHIPALGWIMQMNYFLFVARRWDRDKHSMASFLEYHRVMNMPYQLLLFPEGTDLSPQNVEKSDAFAHKNDLPHYKNVLHPRYTGFTYLTSTMLSRGELHAVYDVTIAYPRTVPADETSVLRGELPEAVHFHIKRIAAEELSSEEGSLKTWLAQQWHEKEERLNKFHQKGQFQESGSEIQWTDNTQIYSAFIFWTAVDIVFILGILGSWMFRVYTVLNCALFLSISYSMDGFYNFERYVLFLKRGL